MKKENELLLSSEQEVIYLLQVLDTLRGIYQGSADETMRNETIKKINKISKKLTAATEKYILV